MSLATRCPACGTVFRVVQDQLKVSQGWVRCGQCHEVFNALESLFDLDNSPSPAPTPTPADAPSPSFAATEPSPLEASPPPPEPTPEEAPLASPPPPPAPSLPSPPAPAPVTLPSPPPPAPAAPAEPAPEPEPEVGANEEASAEPTPPAGYELPGDGGDDSVDAPDTDALAAPFGASRLPEPWEREALTPEEANPEPEAVVPRFLQQADRQVQGARRVRRALLAVLCALLLLALGGQLTLQGRDLLAAHWPASRPYLAALCGTVGCEVGAPMALDQIVLDSSQLQTTEVPGELTITAELRNRAGWPVRRPSLELTLTSDDGLTLARRVLSPAELGATDTTLPSEGSWHAQVRLDVAPLKVTGYALEVFYP
ncbi:zinc-ribbon and DUF3426 domain-containing protein [Ideonella oryzae]|uniref:Zinc-ribbon domain-containing protein n=1 Tax=Ideonella oryzae TaxID=2937441 RepID=A0ABT1BKW7_9BURK|nr:zinc-ribbon and DUF3426 domain-containing protein [Ideonella oryzae]MCO5976865.1 zinc-ribbon domain-containing protein [Ideonella oryzae]